MKYCVTDLYEDGLKFREASKYYKPNSGNVWLLNVDKKLVEEEYIRKREEYFKCENKMRELINQKVCESENDR
ncbi:MAG: hypothetical protein WC516_05245 [Patescibacteria group bacterium]|jgi:hypothetical protein